MLEAQPAGTQWDSTWSNHQSAPLPGTAHQTQAEKEEEVRRNQEKANNNVRKAKNSHDLETLLGLVAPEPLIPGRMSKQGLVQIYGQPYAGKTFVAVGLACSIAAGKTEWMGLDLNTGGIPQDVIYVAGEGGHVFKEQVRGWLLHPENRAYTSRVIEHLHVIDESLPFEDGRTFAPKFDVNWARGKTTEEPGSDPQILWYEAARIESLPSSQFESVYDPVSGEEVDRPLPRKVAAIFIDPQVNSIVANEQDNSEMGAVFTALRQHALINEVLLVLVAHTGKDGSKGSRGASAQLGAIDTEIACDKRSGMGKGTMRWGKTKGFPGTTDKDSIRYHIINEPGVAIVDTEVDTTATENDEKTLRDVMRDLSQQNRVWLYFWATQKVHGFLPKLDDTAAALGMPYNNVKSYQARLRTDHYIVNLNAGQPGTTADYAIDESNVPAVMEPFLYKVNPVQYLDGLETEQA